MPFASQSKNQMWHIYLIVFTMTLFGCKSDKTSKQIQTAVRPTQQINDCPPGEETFNLVTVFVKDTAQTPTKLFFSIVDFVKSKGLFKPPIDKDGKVSFEKTTEKTFPVVYDTCDMKRWVTKNFIMKNMRVSGTVFNGTKKERFTGLTPGFSFEEWKFADNTDRDSAMKIVKKAYTYHDNVVMYEKRYSQFMLADRRILLLEAGAAFEKSYAVQYKKLIEQFLKVNYK